MSLGIFIRKAEESDRTFLREMFYEAIYVPAGQERPDFKIIFDPKLSRYTENWMQPTDLGVIAIHGNEPVGASWIRFFRAENPGYGYVDETTPELTIAVKAGYRGKGIGHTLITRLLQAAAEAGWQAVSLSVTKENTAAVSLYKKAGFTIVSENQEDLVMVYQFCP